MSRRHELPGLWSSVAHVARERVAVLERAVDGVRRSAPDRATLCGLAVEEAEKLVGSLDSYGVTGGSKLAARAGELLSQDSPELEELSAVVARLRSLVG